MIWISLPLCASVICFMALCFSGLIYRIRQVTTLARRLELGSRRKAMRFIPIEYRSHAVRDLIISISVLLLLMCLLALLQFLPLYSSVTSDYQMISGVLMLSLMSIPFVWVWCRCLRRSRNEIADLGTNPFDVTKVQRWLSFGHYLFMLITLEMALIYFERYVVVWLSVPILLAFLLFVTATKSGISCHENGIFLGFRFYTWGEIAWYRWYDNRCGVIFGHRTWQCPYLVHYLPAEEIGSDRLEELLNQYLPGKQRETVEDYLMSYETHSIQK